MPSAADSSWQPESYSASDPYYYLPYAAEDALGTYNFIAAYVGLDQVSFVDGSNTPQNLTQKIPVAVYESQYPWVGYLGISGRPTYIFGSGNAQPSALESFSTRGLLSWGYTAGAYYTDPPTYGSLTFGGYDPSLFNSSSAVTFDMNTKDTALDLEVTLQEIEVIGDATTTSISGLPVKALIDSTVPEIWLSDELADTIASAYGLVWNETYNYYFIDDSRNSALVGANHDLGLVLAAEEGSKKRVSITLPYQALAQSLSYPLAGIGVNDTALRYLAIRRTGNDTSKSQMYLGRAFLQEAYITADYNKSTFQVGQLQGATSLVTVGLASHVSLSAGDKAGIALGACSAVLLLVALGIWIWRKRSGKSNETKDGSPDTPFMDAKAELDNTAKRPVPPEELGSDGNMFEMDGMQKPMEADNMHAVVELPGDYEGYEAPSK